MTATVPGTSVAPADPPDPAMLPETAQILLLATGKWITQSLYAAAALKIADLVHDGPRDAAGLAAATGTHARSLYRVLRAVASVGIFAEDEQGLFHQTPLSEVLRSDIPGSVRDAVIFFGSEFTWRPYGSILDTVRTGAPAFNSLNHVENMFGYLGAHPDEQEIFDRAMTALSGDSVADITELFEFAGYATVVDVGGGCGFLLAEVLAANPGVTGVLADRRNVLPGAEQTFAARDVRDRARLVECDFFAGVPGGGDAYILKSVLHDWTDEESLRILANIRAAMADNRRARLLIIEAVVPESNSWAFAKLMDIEMMVNVGGVERTGREWAALLDRAGFELERTVEITPPNSIIVGRPR